MIKWYHPSRWLVLLVTILFACSPSAKSSMLVVPSSLPPVTPKVTPTSIPSPASPTAAATLPTPTPPRLPSVWVSPALPQTFRDQFTALTDLPHAVDSASANIRLDIFRAPDAAMVSAAHSAWVYALAAPFPTVTDAVSRQDLLQLWKSGTPIGVVKHLLVSVETRAMLEMWWGTANPISVQTLDPADQLDTVWNDPTTWAILPFDAITPRWKVLRVEGISPFDQPFDAQTYPLALPIQLSAAPEAIPYLPPGVPLPTNRDPQKLTTLVMTGVTALSRHIGERMEAHGSTYPDQDIREWLANADLTHISNEVSFYADCPKPGPERADMRFCSNPKYISLLEDAGTDIVELTGNHMLDWGIPPFLETLRMYQQRGWGTYGGGASLAEAKKPLLIENHGNKLAFLGCSPSGPETVWATADKAGSNPCNFDTMEREIQTLRAQGYLPIVTFQAVETDAYVPTPAQGTPNFRRMAQAGAVIVSGSQSHVPQTMTFVGDHFVHYGLGNLFFDQMEPLAARQEFIDRHVFYNGQYLGVELKTALLEDYARPRPMTSTERSDFLTNIFGLSIWKTP